MWAERPARKKENRQMANPLKFVQEVRSETSKVTWPTRNEVAVTTVMVFILATLAAIFFFIADQILSWLVSLLLGLAG
jgi:preprotein translocase subunit SecE